LIAVDDVVGACVAGAVVAAAVAELLVPEFPLVAFFVATGFALFVAAAVVFVEEAVTEVDDEADATAVAPCPAAGAPAMLIARVAPN
jgi:CBS domain containing-hemolysin-like protein